jgi:hypothetical protein
MNWTRVFLYVTTGALIGMLLGGLFGFAAGSITSDFFLHIIPWQDVEPKGFATFCGATVGVVLGGGLACFGIIVQLILEKWRQ